MHEQAPSPIVEAPVQPVTNDAQPLPVESAHGLARADTFGSTKQDPASTQEEERTTDAVPATAQASSTDVAESSKTSEPHAAQLPASVPASESNASSETSKKTFFSAFVSPFDAFDAPAVVASPAAVPASESVSTASTVTTKKSKKEKSTKDVAKASTGSTSAVDHEASAVNAAPVEVAKRPEVVQKAKPVKETASIPSAPSAVAPSKKAPKQEDIPVIYRSSAFVDESRTTTPLVIPAADYVFDVSEPHVESLVHDAKRFDERRISNIRTHVMTHGLGAASLLKAGTNALVYALPKGKARVVNQDTAASTLVTLQSSETALPINVVDLAVTDEWVVLLGEDGSFGIWVIDLVEEDSSIFSERVFFYSAEKGSLVPRRVELTRSGQADSLIIMTESSLYSVAVEKLIKDDQKSSLVKKMDVKFESSHSVSPCHSCLFVSKLSPPNRTS